MKIWKTVLPMMSSFLLLSRGCPEPPKPERSLSPLFEQKDVVFEDALVGTWVTVEGEEEGEKGETYTWTFKKSEDNAYEVTFPLDEGKEGKSEAHLVRLGKYLFLDVFPANWTKDESMPFPVHIVDAHVFGRIWIEEDSVRIALLDDEWVAGREKLGVSYASTGHGSVLTASTEELQKFTLQYAEDPKAFSFEVGLCREGSDCKIAPLKHKLEINPNDAKTWESLGWTYFGMGRYDEALAAFNKAAQIDPDDRDYHEQIGLALMMMSRYEEARKELQETDAIAVSYFLEGRFPEAVSAFEKSPSESATIMHNLALRHVGKQAEAQKLLQGYAWPVADTQWELLRLAYLHGLIAEERLISKAETAEEKSEAHFFVGYEYLLKGDKQKAREYFQKVLDTKVVNSDEYIVVRARLAQLGTK